MQPQIIILQKQIEIEITLFAKCMALIKISLLCIVLVESCFHQYKYNENIYIYIYIYWYHVMTDVCTAALLPTNLHQMTTLGSGIVLGSKYHYC